MSEFTGATSDRNTITLRGRLGEAPKLIASGERSTAVGLRLAVDDGYYDRQTGRWVERPTVWHDVIVFGALAENAFDSLMNSDDNGKGLLVTVTGSFSDDSYTRESFRPDGEDITIRRLKLRAIDVACSFRRATAIVRKKRTPAPEQGRGAAATSTTPPNATVASTAQAAPVDGSRGTGGGPVGRGAAVAPRGRSAAG